MLIRNCTFIQIPLVKIKVLLSITCHYANIYMYTKLLQNATQNYKAMLLYTQQRIAKRAYLLYHQAILHVTENKQYYSHSSSDPQGHMHIRTLKKKQLNIEKPVSCVGEFSSHCFRDSESQSRSKMAATICN